VSNERIKFDDKLPFDAFTMLPVNEFIELALIMLAFTLFNVPLETLAYLVSDWLLDLASMANLFGVNGAAF
jgi:hypothetical protein